MHTYVWTGYGSLLIFADGIWDLAYKYLLDFLLYSVGKQTQGMGCPLYVYISQVIAQLLQSSYSVSFFRNVACTCWEWEENECTVITWSWGQETAYLSMRCKRNIYRGSLHSREVSSPQNNLHFSWFYFTCAKQVNIFTFSSDCWVVLLQTVYQTSCTLPKP